MTCNCNQKNTIKVTADCSKNIVFTFDSEIDGYSAEFCVRADLDSEPVLTKTISDLSGNVLNLTLTPADMSVFNFSKDDYVNQYIWGLDVYNDSIRTSVFPQLGELPPLFIVYRHIVGD